MGRDAAACSSVGAELRRDGGGVGAGWWWRWGRVRTAFGLRGDQR